MGILAETSLYTNKGAEPDNPDVASGLETLRQNQLAIREMVSALPPEELTIADGSISPTRAEVVVDTEGGAPADELAVISPQVDAVNALHPGMIISLRRQDASRAITVRHSQGVNGIRTYNNKDVGLEVEWPLLLRLEDTGDWKEIPGGRRAWDAAEEAELKIHAAQAEIDAAQAEIDAAQAEIDAAKSRGQIGEYVVPAGGNQDLDSYTTSGAYAVNLTGLTHGPGLNQGVLQVHSRDKDALIQIYVESNHDPARMAIRSLKASVWTPWRRMLTTEGGYTEACPMPAGTGVGTTLFLGVDNGKNLVCPEGGTWWVIYIFSWNYSSLTKYSVGGGKIVAGGTILFPATPGIASCATLLRIG